MNISLRQLEAFLAVSQLSGFTRAADRLHLTQSAVSLLVRELESQLSVRLFDRTTRAVRLTDAGRELYPFAEKALAELQAGIDNTRDLLAKKRGRVTTAIGMVESGLGVAVLPSYILLSTRHSRVETRLIGEPVVDREISIVTRAGKSLSPAAADFALFAKHHVRESLASGRRF